MSPRNVLFMALLSFTASVRSEEPRPIFSDEEFPVSEIREIERPTRPTFVAEPFFEEDVWVDTKKSAIQKVECMFDGPLGLGSVTGMFSHYGATPEDSDRWAWPDRGRAWTARVGMIFMSRTDPSGGVLFSNPAVATDQISADSFDFPFESGFEFNFIAHDILPFIAEDADLEFRYFNLNAMQANTTASFVGPTSRIHSFPLTTFPGTDDVSATYSSEFENLELNVRYEMENGWLTWIAGARAINLDESLHARFVDRLAVDPTVEVDMKTNNNLLGVQAGGQIALKRSDRWCVDMTSKVGLMANHVVNNGTLDGFAGTDIDASLTDMAFLFEWGLMSRYTISDHWSGYLGYQVLWLEGVGLASRQFSAADFTSGSGIDTDSSAVLHGLQLGFELRY